jgi:hypothetical protein
MRARSWMAIFALVVGSSVLVAWGVTARGARPSLEADEAQSQGPESPAPAAQTTPLRATEIIIPNVQLNLVIAGLGRGGCDVEIKPGNRSCRFRAVGGNGAAGRHHVAPEGKAKLELRDVELRGADRTCTVAITVYESGQGPKTVYRGFRLPQRSRDGATDASEPVPAFTCYLSSPSKLASGDDARARK